MSTDIHYPVAHRDQALIDSFKTRYEDFDQSVIPGIILDVMGLEVQSIERSPSWGTAHVIYYLKFKGHRDLVFRANINMPDPEVEMLVEKLITDLLATKGITTNRILHVDISRAKYPFDFTIQERLGGIDPEDEFNGIEEEYDQFNFETGQAMAKLSEIKLKGFGRFDPEEAKKGNLVGAKSKLSDYIETSLDDDLNALVEFRVIDEDQLSLIKKFFADHREMINIQQGSLVHYDLADHNLRYKDGHLEAIFDWETAVVADPILDLASCPTWKSHYAKREKILEGYQSIKPLPDNFEELEKVYLLRTMIWKLRFLIRSNILNESWRERFKDVMAGIVK